MLFLEDLFTCISLFHNAKAQQTSSQTLTVPPNLAFPKIVSKCFRSGMFLRLISLGACDCK